MLKVLTICAVAAFAPTGCNPFLAIKKSCPKALSTNMSPGQFYSLSAADNRLLWYEEIKLPCGRKTTSYWDDYHQNNYHADGIDFINYFSLDSTTNFALQFGPNYGDLWAYHSYVGIRQADSILIVHSYFRHARFTHKCYSVCSNSTISRLRSLLLPFKELGPDSTWSSDDQSGYVVDNVNRFSFIFDFEKAYQWITIDSLLKKKVQTDEFKQLNDFISDSITWQTTYSL